MHAVFIICCLKVSFSIQRIYWNCTKMSIDITLKFIFRQKELQEGCISASSTPSSSLSLSSPPPLNCRQKKQVTVIPSMPCYSNHGDNSLTEKAYCLSVSSGDTSGDPKDCLAVHNNHSTVTTTIASTTHKGRELVYISSINKRVGSSAVAAADVVIDSSFQWCVA